MFKPEKDNSEKQSQYSREKAALPPLETGCSIKLGPFLPIERIGTGVDHEIAECTEDGVARANGFVAVLEEDFNHGAKLIEARFAVVSEADGRDGFPRGR